VLATQATFGSGLASEITAIECPGDFACPANNDGLCETVEATFAGGSGDWAGANGAAGATLEFGGGLGGYGVEETTGFYITVRCYGDRGAVVELHADTGDCVAEYRIGAGYDTQGPPEGTYNLHHVIGSGCAAMSGSPPPSLTLTRGACP
jgi:hypothetical protein